MSGQSNDTTAAPGTGPSVQATRLAPLRVILMAGDVEIASTSSVATWEAAMRSIIRDREASS